MKKGSLTVVGTGIRTVGQMTMEAIASIRHSDRVFYVVGDPVAEFTLRRLNPRGAQSLAGCYAEGKPRIDSYNEMIDRILAAVRQGLHVCAAFYGHPGVFVYPSHHSIRRAREEGYSARMLPGISAEDCLFADLGIDPAMFGCQSFEATDFALNHRQIDPGSSVILWQIGVVGNWAFHALQYDQSMLPVLLQALYRYYPPEHTVYVYEAATLPGCEPVIKPCPLSELDQAGLSPASTLYIPPLPRKAAAPSNHRHRRATGAA